jgi:hypothetical protein
LNTWWARSRHLKECIPYTEKRYFIYTFPSPDASSASPALIKAALTALTLSLRKLSCENNGHYKKPLNDRALGHAMLRNQRLQLAVALLALCLILSVSWPGWVKQSYSE